MSTSVVRKYASVWNYGSAVRYVSYTPSSSVGSVSFSNGDGPAPPDYGEEDTRVARRAAVPGKDATDDGSRGRPFVASMRYYAKTRSVVRSSTTNMIRCNVDNLAASENRRHNAKEGKTGPKPPEDPVN